MLSLFYPVCIGVLFYGVVLGCKYTLPKLLDRIVSDASILTRSVFEWDISHRRSVAALQMLYKINCNQICILFMGLYQGSMCQCELHSLLRSHIGTLMRLLAAEPRIVRQDFYSLVSISVERSWCPRIRWCGGDGFQGRAGPMPCYWPAGRSHFVSCCFPFLFFHSTGWYCEAGVLGLIWC